MSNASRPCTVRALWCLHPKLAREVLPTTTAPLTSPHDNMENITAEPAVAGAEQQTLQVYVSSKSSAHALSVY
jgi:hypothetical protein